MENYEKKLWILFLIMINAISIVMNIAMSILGLNTSSLTLNSNLYHMVPLINYWLESL